MRFFWYSTNVDFVKACSDGIHDGSMHLSPLEDHFSLDTQESNISTSFSGMVQSLTRLPMVVPRSIVSTLDDLGRND